MPFVGIAHPLDYVYIERFSIECRKHGKTKPKVITPTNHKNVNNTKDQSEFEANTCNRRQAREQRVRERYDWFWFYFSLVEKMA